MQARFARVPIAHTRRTRGRKRDPLRSISCARQLDLQSRRSAKRGWKKPTWGRIIDETAARVVAFCEARTGVFYDHLRTHRNAVSGRHIRSDGLVNLISLLVCMVTHATAAGALCDMRNGGRWWTFEELSERAFGKFVGGSLGISRIRYWCDVLKAAGFIEVRQQVMRNPERPDEVQPAAAVKLLTSSFFACLGLYELAQRAIVGDHRKRMARYRPELDAGTNRSQAGLRQLGQVIAEVQNQSTTGKGPDRPPKPPPRSRWEDNPDPSHLMAEQLQQAQQGYAAAVAALQAKLRH